jgi:hypothetical protein
MAKYLTYCDVVRAGACIDGVISWCKENGNKFFLKISDAVKLKNEWIDRTLGLNGYGNRYGNGYGYGNGDGDGYGYGYGNGNGDGYGYGNGYGYGDGYGNGYADGGI